VRAALTDGCPRMHAASGSSARWISQPPPPCECPPKTGAKRVLRPSIAEHLRDIEPVPIPRLATAARARAPGAVRSSSRHCRGGASRPRGPRPRRRQRAARAGRVSEGPRSKLWTPRREVRLAVLPPRRDYEAGRIYILSCVGNWPVWGAHRPAI